MASGWQTNDVQTQERRNREWIARYLLGLPFPDRDDAGTPQVLPRAVAAALPTTEAAFWTFLPSALVIVHKVTLTSTVDVERTAWIGLHTAAFSNPADIIVITKSLQPREVITFDGPWLCPGASSVRGWASAAGVTVRLDYTVCLSTTPGITPVFGRVALTATPTAHYTAPSDVQSAYVASLGFATTLLTDFSTTIVVELLPTGQASAPQFYVANAPMAGWETEIVGGYTLQPGDAIRAWRIGTDPGGFAFNVVEFRG